MKMIVLSMMSAAALAACGVADSEELGETSQASFGRDVFYENFNSLNLGPVAGQAGWELPPGALNSCVVVPGMTNGDKNLDCSYDNSQNGQGALHRFITPPNRNYHLQFDVWMAGVTEATHGKLFLEKGAGTGAGTIFQLATGCSANHAGIRVTFEYGGPVMNLLTDADCNGHYRVACIWHDDGLQLRCGASRLPYDPEEAQFQVMNTPEAIHAFDLVRVLGGIGPRRGTTTFDKIQVLSD